MELNQIFCNGLVLQADRPIRIFGTGSGKATVELDGVTGTALTTKDNWLVELPPHTYGGPYTMKVTLNGYEQILSDIYIGDVILLSGQSNLQFKLQASTTPKEEYQSNSLLRLFTIERLEEGEFFFPEDGWVYADKESVGKWSAVGYLTGNLHNKNTGHAVGVIACYQGASMIQSWLPENILLGTECDIAAEIRSGTQRRQQYMAWNHDGQLYKEMFLKLVPFSMKAVIWYQGEANTHPPENTTEIYSGMLCRLINCWRKDLMDEKLPFIVVQLADYIHSNPEGWKAVQQAQLNVPNQMEKVYSITCADICEDNDIHPPTKFPLAVRIANLLKRI